MSLDLVKITYRHSTGLDLGIDIFSLRELYNRQPDISHRITEPHSPGFYILIYVTDGNGHHTVDFKSYKVAPNTLIIVSKHQVQQFDSRLLLDGYMILITEEFLHQSLFDLDGGITRLLFEPITTQAYFLHNAYTLLPHVERLIEEYQDGNDIPDQSAILTRELGILLIKTDRMRRSQLSESDNKAETSLRLVAFRDLLQLHFRDHWTAQQYADELRFSKKTLGSLTRKYLNRTPKEIIDQRLLLEIKRLLAHTDLSIKEIGFQLGFDDPSNLNKFFRRMKGNTPTEFRRSIQHPI